VLNSWSIQLEPWTCMSAIHLDLAVVASLSGYSNRRRSRLSTFLAVALIAVQNRPFLILQAQVDRAAIN